MLYFIRPLIAEEDDHSADAIIYRGIEIQYPHLSWNDGQICRVIRKQSRHYTGHWAAFGRVEIGEILILLDFNWRQIR